MTDKRKWTRQQRAVSAAMKKLWADPVFRRKMIKKLKAKWKDPVFRKKVRNMKGVPKSAETKKKMSIAAKKRWKNVNRL